MLTLALPSDTSPSSQAARRLPAAKKAFGGPGEEEDGCPWGCLEGSAHKGYKGGAKRSLDQETSYLGAYDLN